MGTALHRAASAIVEAIYGAAGARLSEPPGPGHLVSALLGSEALEYDRRRFAPPASLFRRDGRWRVAIHASLSDPDTTMAVAGALARWWCQTRPQPAPLLKLDELLPRGIVLPPPALAMAVRVYGLTAAEISETYVCPLAVVRAQMWALARPASSGTFRRIDDAG